MAKMIPDSIMNDEPPGEISIFNRLKNCEANWVAFHSLDLTPWCMNKRTEIDFVVIVPESGIVCIEVKSSENINFDGSKWTSGILNKKMPKDPFKQAKNTRFAFHRRLEALSQVLKDVPVVHFCIFPNSNFNFSPNMSVDKLELMDKKEYGSLKTDFDFCAEIKKRIEQIIEKDPQLAKLKTPLTDKEIEQIIELCYPVQKYKPTLKDEIKQHEEQLEKILRQQQKPILNLFKNNDRIIIYGGAGTGKTLIAMKLARLKALEGNRVGLLCFNRLISEWMIKEISKLTPNLPNLVIGPAMNIMAKLTDTAIPNNAKKEFWEKEFPEKIQEKLTDPDFNVSSQFDYLVLDEAQDLLAKPIIWQCLTNFIKDGIKDGKYAIFGDFKYQIFGKHENVEKELINLKNIAHPAIYELSENCRNYKIIGETAVKLSNIDENVYTEYKLSTGEKDDCKIEFFSSDEDQIKKLDGFLNEAIKLGIKPKYINILSFVAFEKSLLHKELSKDLITKYKLVSAVENKQNDSITYSTVHAFKGMENTFIILIDVNPKENSFYSDLIYTAMTRSKKYVRILCISSSKEDIKKIITV